VQQQQQQQTVTPPPQLTSPERRTMPTSGLTTPHPAYPSPNGFPSRPSRQDANMSTTRWVRKFLSSRPKDTLLPIPREYLSDGFNLVQLAPIVERIGRMENGCVLPAMQNESYPLFKAALRLILQQDGEQSSTTASVQRAAEVLYTLVHARYAISPRGLDTVRRVLRRSDGTVDPVFGRCPRIRCRGMPLLPWGDSDNYDPRNCVTTRAKRYCPCCGEVRPAWYLPVFFYFSFLTNDSSSCRNCTCGMPRQMRVHGGLPSVTCSSCFMATLCSQIFKGLSMLATEQLQNRAFLGSSSTPPLSCGTSLAELHTW
jgi:hypothetical protein